MENQFAGRTCDGFFVPAVGACLTNFGPHPTLLIVAHDEEIICGLAQSNHIVTSVINTVRRPGDIERDLRKETVEQRIALTIGIVRSRMITDLDRRPRK